MGALLLTGLPFQRTRQVTCLVGRLVGVPLRLRVTTHPGAPMGAPRALERGVGGRLPSPPTLAASPASRCGGRGTPGGAVSACNRIKAAQRVQGASDNPLAHTGP